MFKLILLCSFMSKSISSLWKPWRFLRLEPLNEDQHLDTKHGVCILWTGV